MRSIVLLCFFIVSILVGSSVLAKGSLEPEIVTKLAIQSGHIFLYADEWNNPNNCQNTNAVILQSSDPNYAEAYTLILAAFMSGKTVKGYSDGCEVWDDKSYNTIRGYKYLIIE